MLNSSLEEIFFAATGDGPRPADGAADGTAVDEAPTDAGAEVSPSGAEPDGEREGAA